MYDEKRVAQLKPIRTAIENAGLPLIRMRKLMGILGALEMQIEDGGDSAEVTDLLVQALRAATLHQLGQEQGQSIQAAIDRFVALEKERR